VYPVNSDSLTALVYEFKVSSKKGGRRSYNWEDEESRKGEHYYREWIGGKKHGVFVVQTRSLWLGPKSKLCREVEKSVAHDAVNATA
jgi:hypothetical protein